MRKPRRKMKLFRISYTIKAYDNGEVAKTKTTRDVKAWSHLDAVNELKRLLEIQSERASMDLGVVSQAFCDFQVALVCKVCAGRGHGKIFPVT